MRCDGNWGKLEPKRGVQFWFLLLGWGRRSSLRPQPIPKGDQGMHMDTGVIADGAINSMGNISPQDFFQLIAKEEMVTDAGRRQILPTPDKSH